MAMEEGPLLRGGGGAKTLFALRRRSCPWCLSAAPAPASDSKGAAQAEPSQTHPYYVIIIHYSMYPK
jgi:hypothetical protein